MRTRFIAAAAMALLAAGSTATVHAQMAANPLFTEKLFVGVSNAQVLALQKFLNKDPGTQVASTGPGSPGAETSYFGGLTKAAVIRFQEKYAAQILTPVGLTYGTGYVGSSTRTELNALASALSSSGSGSAQTSSPSTSTGTATSASTTVSTNPNSTHLADFISAVNALGQKQGTNPVTLALIDDAIRAQAATTTDLTKQFLASAPLKIVSALPVHSTARMGLAERVLSFLGFARVADAGAGTPFGGQLYGAIPCTCSAGVWLVYVEPLPPTYAAILSYETGTQLYANHTAPFATELLGAYYPGVPACYFYAGTSCVPSPSEGLISPELGSSL